MSGLDLAGQGMVDEGEQLRAPPLRVRLDPWQPEYDAAIEIAPDDRPAEVDLKVEQPAWSAVAPGARALPERICFVDGVRRIEHRILVETGERVLFGLLGSIGVGATRIRAARAEVVAAEIRRVVAVGGGVDLGAWAVALASGGGKIPFVSLPVADNTPEAPLEALQNSMREAEAALAESLHGEGSLVFLDGTLSFFTPSRIPVVGFVKRLLRTYLPSDSALLLRALRVGERTPLFLIKETRHQRHSWYVRIASGRAIDSALTGIVRLETASAVELEEVRRVADLCAALLPRFASQPGHDPRAPQNLYPVGGLEAVLRHKLGDPLLIRRAIEMHLHGLEKTA